jgi:alpha-tubulin suppressor-like RCC1 family protein
VAIVVGADHSCAALSDGRLKCWGENDHGQLGNGTTIDINAVSGNGGDINLPAMTPINLGATRSAIGVAAGNDHTCALLDDHSIKCWGKNYDGQLGNGNNADLNAPSPIPVDLTL